MSEVSGWHGWIYHALGFSVDAGNHIANAVLGAIYFIPVFLVTNIVGGFWEALFSTIRKHEINEGFLVTGLLFPLILPPTIPLWQVALGISFGVVVAKEIFGGTGKNFLNVALSARAFLFFAYPAQISGDAVWIAVDGYTGATALSSSCSGGVAALELTFGMLSWVYSWIYGRDCASVSFGAGYLIYTGIGSWRIMLSVVLSTVAFAALLNMIGSDTNPMFALSPAWHLVILEGLLLVRCLWQRIP